MLKTWHELHKNAIAGTITLPLEEPYSVKKLEGSNFRISSGQDSPGIQAIDVVIWLFKRTLENKEIGYNSSRLIRHVFKRAYQNDLSFEGIGQMLEAHFKELYDKPFTGEHQKKAETFAKFAEERRQEAMFGYAEKNRI